MNNINRQIEAYKENRDVKIHDLELLKIIQDDFPNFTGNMLDIGCAAGSFIEFMSEHFPDAKYTGFDLSQELIDIALEKKLTAKCHFSVNDALSFSPDRKFDIIVASGVLSIFEDFTEPLEKWLSWMGDQGVLYIFGRFNSKDIDTIVRFRNNYNNSNDWEGGLTSYSLKTINSYLANKGYSGNFKRFHLPVTLKENLNPIRTFTKETTDGDTLVINGANIVAEHYFLRIKKLQS